MWLPFSTEDRKGGNERPRALDKDPLSFWRGSFFPSPFSLFSFPFPSGVRSDGLEG